MNMNIKKMISALEEMLDEMQRKREKKILKEKLSGLFDSDSHTRMNALVLSIYVLKEIENRQFKKLWKDRGLVMDEANNICDFIKGVYSV